MRLALAAFVGALAAAPCAADEWRLASVQEILASWGDDMGSSATNQVVADFDGNNVPDAARVLRSESTGRLELFVALNEGTPHYRLLRLNEMDGLGIQLKQPGTYQTLCGKGYECPEGGLHTMTLSHAAVEVFKPGSASWVIYWDSETQTFKEFGTSD